MKEKFNFTVIIISIMFFMGYQVPAAAEKSIKLETMTVTATKSKKDIDGVSAFVLIIGKKEIEKLGACDLKSVFEKTRGLQFSMAFFRQPAVFQRVQHQSERIEIIKGPMSVLYGVDAVGGVITLSPKSPKKDCARVLM